MRSSMSIAALETRERFRTELAFKGPVSNRLVDFETDTGVEHPRALEWKLRTDLLFFIYLRADEMRASRMLQLLFF